ncbi:YceI family protein [Engelhardtia mirabilis]|uniref:Lipid/polyisoprenoid-binding YceI-like domain-containing protein n=1 Tax=Engelhardtia mirabilis TaxID=2528011 RepID=A0A518BNZ4_9BACT|nr:hypothetical protein Pla133_38050 [Planctomycetes bacterium Pla133]QDV03029.1 hypothetical protein Pla86_38040 [Planctomycetes bacterium Pla86]
MLNRLLLAGGALVATAAALLIAPAPAVAVAPVNTEGATYDIDAGHSSIHFDVEHLGLSRAWGRFNEFEGSFTSGEKAADMSVELTVKTATVDTNNPKRDEHLRSADFFNAAQFPEMKFVSTAVKKKRDGQWDLEGNLTMLGTTAKVAAELTMVGSGEDPWGGTRAGYTATFTVDRTDFGMDAYEGTLGNEVNVRVDLEGVLRK